MNFDGLMGPTHNYSGLAFGNVASMDNRGLVSSPLRAALQGLEKMKLLHDLGLKQAVLPPQPRPALGLLREYLRHSERSEESLGGSMGIATAMQPVVSRANLSPRNDVSDDELITAVYKSSPQLLSAFYSASSMWTANAATVSPSADTIDGRLHLSVSNLASGLHRSIEPSYTYAALKQIFADESCFALHEAITPSLRGARFASLTAGCGDEAISMGDEGAANHNRFAKSYGEAGLEIFVYGGASTKYPARQSLTASMLVAERHGLNPDACIFAEQSAIAIDAGVFHNDVISVSNQTMYFCHEDAFTDTSRVIDELREKFPQLSLYMVSGEQLALEDAVKSYLYNSQIITLANGEMLLIAPLEARENQASRRVIEQLLAADNPVTRVEFLDLRESMRNGGGPACLRLRVVMTDRELSAMKQSVLFTDKLYTELKACIQKTYREELRPEDLGDTKFAMEAMEAYRQVIKVLGLTAVS